MTTSIPKTSNSRAQISKAMIFAAGLGTRLRPLTDDRPKALVEIYGRTLLELTLSRLRAFGVRDVVINVHHFADRVVEYLKARDDFKMNVRISREEMLLDTGGGLKEAAKFFEDFPGDPESPIVVHNVDVVSTIDLTRLVQAHITNRALATLAVQRRKTSRYLLFDEHLLLCGRRIGSEATAELVRSTRKVQSLAFSGIHIISPRLFSKLSEEGAFSIIKSYLRLAGLGDRILGFRADDYYWRDVGRLEDLQQAAREMKGFETNGSGSSRPQ